MSLTSDDSYVAPITARPAARVTASASKPEEEVCAVCLDALEEGQRVRKLPCDHVYHDPCAVVWLIKADRCPVCARPVCREEEENREEEVVQPRRRWPSFWNAPSR